MDLDNIEVKVVGFSLEIKLFLCVCSFCLISLFFGVLIFKC